MVTGAVLRRWELGREKTLGASYGGLRRSRNLSAFKNTGGLSLAHGMFIAPLPTDKKITFCLKSVSALLAMFTKLVISAFAYTLLRTNTENSKQIFLEKE